MTRTHIDDVKPVRRQSANVETMKLSDYFKEESCPIFLINLEHHGRTQLHQHEFFELVYVERGIALHSHENSTQILTTGDVFFILPGEVHSYIRTSNTALYNCVFTTEALAGIRQLLQKMPELEFLEKGRDRFTKVHAGMAQMQELHSFLERMNWEQVNQPAGWPLKIHSLLEGLLVAYARLADFSQQIQSAAQSHYREVFQAVEHIEHNYTTDLTSEDLVQITGLSASYLSRQFKRLMNATPAEYIRNFRMAKAAELLRDDSQTVAEVSGKMGFASISLFSRQFRQVTGMTPTQFRSNP